RSTGSSSSRPTVLTSSYSCASGKCRASTLRHNGSISTIQTVVIPARRKPSSNPPMPAKRLPTRTATRLPSPLRPRARVGHPGLDAPEGVGQGLAERCPVAHTIRADGADDPHRPAAARHRGAAGGPDKRPVLGELLDPRDGLGVV